MMFKECDPSILLSKKLINASYSSECYNINQYQEGEPLKITNSMIDPELRTFGRVFKIVIPSFSEAKLRLFHRLRRNPKVKAYTFQYREQWLRSQF